MASSYLVFPLLQVSVNARCLLSIRSIVLLKSSKKFALVDPAYHYCGAKDMNDDCIEDQQPLVLYARWVGGLFYY